MSQPVVAVESSSLSNFGFTCVFYVIRANSLMCKRWKENPQKLTQIKFKISSKTPRGKKDSTKRHHHRHHKRQPGEQQFPKQVVTG